MLAVAEARTLYLREAGLPEREIAKLWRERARRLHTLDGRKLEVLYPGRPAPGHGPDFRDAIVRLDGERLHGDVEVHRRPAGWREHGHHLDVAYDGVMLHVVGSDDGPPGPAGMPAVVMPPDSPMPMMRGSKGPLAYMAALGPAERQGALHAAGLAWFAERTAGAAATAQVHGIEQALYVGIMEALGYAENRAPFNELAARVPFAVLTAVARSVSAHRLPNTMRNLLLGGSGLAPVTQEWVEYVGTAPLGREYWRTSGMRPANHPRKRLDAAAVLLAEHARTGLGQGLSQAMRTGGWRGLVSALSTRGESGAIGTGRAGIAAVNGVLPTLAAWAKSSGNDALGDACTAAFAAAPALPSNTMTREAMRLAGMGPSERLGACEGQGLLRLYRQAVHTPA